jgi:hypothetical protein
MPVYGNFETYGDFRPRRPGEEVAWYRCRPIAGDAPGELLLKLFTPASDSLDSDRIELELTQFVRRAHRQQAARAIAPQAWGEIEESGKTDESAFYVTSRHEKGLNELPRGATLPPPSLHRILLRCVQALRSLQQAGTPGHGAIHAGNVLVSSSRGGLVNDVVLCDPRADDELSPNAEFDDLSDLGRLLYRLGTGRPEYRSTDDVAVSASPRFENLGKLANPWRNTIRRLVDPSAPDVFTLESLEAHVSSLEPRSPVSRKMILTASAASLVLLAGAGAATWWFTRPPPSPETVTMRAFDRAINEARSRDSIVPDFSAAVEQLRKPNASVSDIESWTTAARDAFKAIDQLDRSLAGQFFASETGKTWMRSNNPVTDAASLADAIATWDSSAKVEAARTRYAEQLTRAQTLESIFPQISARLGPLDPAVTELDAIEQRTRQISQTIDALAKAIDTPGVSSFLAGEDGRIWLAKVDPIVSAGSLAQDALAERDRLAGQQFELIVARAQTLTDLIPDLPERLRALPLPNDVAFPLDARNTRARAIVEGFEQTVPDSEVVQFLQTGEGAAWRAGWLEQGPLDQRASAFLVDAAARMNEIRTLAQRQQEDLLRQARDAEALKLAQEQREREQADRTANLDQAEEALQSRASGLPDAEPGRLLEARLAEIVEPAARETRLAELTAAITSIEQALQADDDGLLKAFLESQDQAEWTPRPDALSETQAYLVELRTRASQKRDRDAAAVAEAERLRLQAAELESQNQQNEAQRQLNTDWQTLRQRAADAGAVLREPASQQQWQRFVEQTLPDDASSREQFETARTAFDGQSAALLAALATFESAGDTLTASDAELDRIDGAIAALSSLTNVPSELNQSIDDRKTALDLRAVELTSLSIASAVDAAGVLAAFNSASPARQSAIAGDALLRVEIAQRSLSSQQPEQAKALIDAWIARASAQGLKDRLAEARRALDVPNAAPPPAALGPFTLQASGDGLLRYVWTIEGRTHELAFRPVPGRSDWYLAETVVSVGMFVDLFNQNQLGGMPDVRRAQLLGAGGERVTPLSGANPFNVVARAGDRLRPASNWLGALNGVSARDFPLPAQGIPQATTLPMIWLSAQDASQIAASLSARLPTLDVWQSAARGTEPGNQLDIETLRWNDNVLQARGTTGALLQLRIVGASIAPPDEPSLATARTRGNDSFLFAPAGTPGQGFQHLLGNVFQFVESPGGVVAVGGSGLTLRSAEALLEPVTPRNATAAYADTGVRLALELAGGSAPNPGSVLAQVLRP